LPATDMTITPTHDDYGDPQPLGRDLRGVQREQQRRTNQQRSDRALQIVGVGNVIIRRAPLARPNGRSCRASS
jgi:hypothetical protein